MSAEEAVGTLALVDAEEVGQVVELVMDEPNAVLVNRDRGLLQILGCKGNVVAQTPLTPTLLAALEGFVGGGYLLAAVPTLVPLM